MLTGESRNKNDAYKYELRYNVEKARNAFKLFSVCMDLYREWTVAEKWKHSCHKYKCIQERKISTRFDGEFNYTWIWAYNL